MRIKRRHLPVERRREKKKPGSSATVMTVSTTVRNYAEGGTTVAREERALPPLAEVEGSE